MGVSLKASLATAIMRVIIIGSGIAGLSTAIALRRVGIDVSLYERASELTEVGAGISLWANALRALDYIGAGDAVRAVGQPMVRSDLRVSKGRRLLFSIPAARFEKKFGIVPFVAMMHRAELVGALARLLPGGLARYGHECVGVETHPDRAVVHFKNGHTDEADLIVGADGIRSAVRAALFGRDEPRYAGYTCWRGVCPRPASLAPGYIAECWGRGQRFGITTLPRDRVYWFATRNEPAGGRSGNEWQTVNDAFRGWADPIPELLATTPPAAILRNDIIDRPPDSNWISGRAVLIGDAAHPTTPNLGQGGCMAIEDAVVLARCVSTSDNLEKGLASFVAERYPRTRTIVKQSWLFGKISQKQGRIICWLRDRIFGLMVPLVGSRGMSKLAAFDVGPLS